MCGIHLSRRPETIGQLKHRGLFSNTVDVSCYSATHEWLPIQTDPNSDDAQPFVYSDGSVLMFNGEIFNYPPEYTSDSAYLKDLFASCNIRDILCEANRWDGFWAIVYITRYGAVYCFTDPLGKKQLYYNELGEICSEIRPLITNNTEADRLFKSSVAKWGYNRDDHTPWSNIRRVLPNKLYSFIGGKILNVDNGDYYSWFNKPDFSDLHDALYESVVRRLMRKNYPVASLLSGGLDSSIITYILCSLGLDVTYYTTDNAEDSIYVNELAGKLGFNPVVMTYDMDKDLADCLKWNETPIDLGSVVPEHKLMSGIKERIVLTGDGADELFGGYRRINQYDSQMSDIFEELVYYHLPRLDRASMRYTIEMRNPFLSHDIVKIALGLPLEQRTNKKVLKDMFKGKLPDSIINRPKLPLKNDMIRNDPFGYRLKLINLFYENL